MLTRDRDRPNTYVDIVEFPSYEDAMKNSELPETAGDRGEDDEALRRARRPSGTSTWSREFERRRCASGRELAARRCAASSAGVACALSPLVFGIT